MSRSDTRNIALLGRICVEALCDEAAYVRVGNLDAAASAADLAEWASLRAFAIASGVAL